MRTRIRRMLPPVRSDVLDRLVGRYLEQPVKASWHGSAADLLRGSLDDARLELGGMATAWLPLEGVVLSARRAELHPGVPATIRVVEPSLIVSVGQRDVARWVERFQLPFELEFGERGLIARAKVAGLQLGEVEARLEVSGGWFVLQPRRASLLGVPNYAAWLFRTYLPLPPLAQGARLEEIAHQEGQLKLRFEIESFDEDLTPGLLRRLWRRVLP
jgi:hypothetical protein